MKRGGEDSTPLRPIPTNCRQLRLSGWERDQACSRDIHSNGRNVIPAAKGIRIERGFGRPTDHYSTGLRRLRAVMLKSHSARNLDERLRSQACVSGVG